MIDAKDTMGSARMPDTEKTKYVDLKKELTEVRELLREMMAAVPAQQEYVTIKAGLSEVAELLTKQGETQELLRGMDAEWRAVTNRVARSMEEAKTERADFKKIYTEVLEKEMSLIAGVREDIHNNDERLFRQIIGMAAAIDREAAVSWEDRARQYGAQVSITLCIIAILAGGFSGVAFLVRLLF